VELLRARHFLPCMDMSSSTWRRVAADVRLVCNLQTKQLKEKLMDFRRSQVVLEVTSSQSTTVPFHKQGRLSLHTSSIIDKRMALRRHPDIVRVLTCWWNTARNVETTPSVAHLQKEQYVQLSCKLYRAMVETWDEADAQAVAEAEWARDVVGTDRLMDKELFFDSIWEFADVYTLGVSAEEYVAFLWKLFWRIAEGTPPNACVWRRDSDISFAPLQDVGEQPKKVEVQPHADGKRRNKGKKTSVRAAKRMASYARLMRPTIASQQRVSERALPLDQELDTHSSRQPQKRHNADSSGVAEARRLADDLERASSSLASALTRRSSTIHEYSPAKLRASLRSSLRPASHSAYRTAENAAAEDETRRESLEGAMLTGRRTSLVSSGLPRWKKMLLAFRRHRGLRRVFPDASQAGAEGPGARRTSEAKYKCDDYSEM
jgi:hypothetical protein